MIQNQRHAYAPSGFTLIELLISVAIISILASVVFPLADLASQRRKEQELHLALRQIRHAIDAYKQAVDEGHIVRSPDQSGYPPTLEILVNGVPDAKSPTDAKIYFLRRIPRNPFAKPETAPAEQGWGKRSYESPPTAPREGKDVFDVYPLTDGIGLNGIPYRQW